MWPWEATMVWDIWLVGMLILSQLSRIIDKENIGLYRDDGLIIKKEPNSPKVDKYRKKITNALKLLGFKIAIKPI